MPLNTDNWQEPEKPRPHQVDEELHGLENSSYYGSSTSFCLTLLSNSLFFAASALYLYLSIVNWGYEQKVKDLPSVVLEAEDDLAWGYWGYDDDYLFETPWTNDEDVWISKYQLVYFAAASGFVFSGIVDLLHWRTWYSALMIVAAGFGVAAAVFVESDPELSNIFNLVSVHVWLLEAFSVTYSRTKFGGVKGWLRLADTSFVVGTLMDVVLSWIFYNGNPLRAGLVLSGVEIGAAGFWMLTATIYLFCTLALRSSQSEPESLPQKESLRTEPMIDVVRVGQSYGKPSVESVAVQPYWSDVESEGYV